jgi:hypothetical protein
LVVHKDKVMAAGTPANPAVLAMLGNPPVDR